MFRCPAGDSGAAIRKECPDPTPSKAPTPSSENSHLQPASRTEIRMPVLAASAPQHSWTQPCSQTRALLSRKHPWPKPHPHPTPAPQHTHTSHSHTRGDHLTGAEACSLSPPDRLAQLQPGAPVQYLCTLFATRNMRPHVSQEGNANCPETGRCTKQPACLCSLGACNPQHTPKRPQLSPFVF